MIKKIQVYFSGIPSVFIDGLIYGLIAFFTAWTAILSSDDAAKYIVPAVLFWSKGFCGAANAVLLALKMYRSTSFADHQKEKKDKENTQFITKIAP